MEKFEDRINLNVKLEELAEVVCLHYKLGNCTNCSVIEIGYEDFNFILETNKCKFVVKVFSKERNDDDAKRLAQRASFAYTNGVSCPKIFKIGNSYLFITAINNTKYRIMVMEYINGKNYFSLNKLPTSKELSSIAKELAKLNLLEFKPPFIYDKWAIINFDKEYKSLISLVDKEDKKLIDIAHDNFKDCDFRQLKYGFVHGDIIETNVIKGEKNKVYFIDFSVSNYLPRIVDLAVTLCDLCLDLENIEVSKKRIKQFIKDYESIAPLAQYEKQSLKIFLECHQAITILQSTREMVVEKNDSIENKQFLEKGKLGLELVLKNNLFD